MFNPVSTYRIQFHKEFNFEQFESIIDYLRELGIQTIYASPVFTSTPGSNHGYDAFNPKEVNPEIGSLEQLQHISMKLRTDGMSWLQDIVPNHMAFDPRNPWLRDVLKQGRTSKYAGYFDINWESPVYEGKLMVPFLGSDLETVISQGELQLTLQNDEVCLSYYDSHYPCNDASVNWIRSKAIEFQDTQNASPEKGEDILLVLEKINSNQELLKNVAALQHYILCNWQETDTQINYRRFFTVNGLICLNIQEEKVFSDFHAFIHQMVKEGVFSGLRIDHIDGLFDPASYTQRLKTLVGDSVYVSVEKILQPDEQLPSRWKVEGNTGYDFLAMVNNLLTWKENEDALRQYYSTVSGQFRSVEQQLRDKKYLILHHYMQGELDNLFRLFLSSNLADEEELKNFSQGQIKKAIADFLIYCPVYRYYGNSMPLEEGESTQVSQVFSRIRQSAPENSAAIDLMEAVMVHYPFVRDEPYRKNALYFFQRCMQFSGPLMAKGFEDTLMYNYFFFPAHNEVGDSPDAFGYSIETFHQKMMERQKNWPLTMNATATHDTKRGEDVRARMNVLSEIAAEWIEQVEQWREINSGLKTDDGPDANDEYFIYHTLLGHYPVSEDDLDGFPQRLEEYLRKALREAKTHSNWTKPNEPYESACIQFAKALLNSSHPFLKSFQSFLLRIVDHGLLNSLSQLALKFTCPGVADTYQGTELWDWSFVDPDNRRPVDYVKRKKFLESFDASNDPGLLQKELWNDRASGRIKLWLVHRSLQLRKLYPQLLTEGDYIPLQVKGSYSRHIIAFARRHRQTMIIVILPLYTSVLAQEQQCSIPEIDWKDTSVLLPGEIMPEAFSLLQSKGLLLGSNLYVKHAFDYLPFAIIRATTTANERSAGLLLHLSSLPSGFGIGDMGPEARKFADFLFRTHQKFWQLLPINPVEGGQGYSPYSATSSKAGNLLFISPEDLHADHWLDQEDLKMLPQEGRTDYAGSEALKKEVLERAWKRFSGNSNDPAVNEFSIFCTREAYWLDDWVVFSLLKEIHEGKPWYEWPEEYKLRHEPAMQELLNQHKETLQKIRWFQYVFNRQWQALKSYCNSRGIQLIGDIPFYVSYDSADVWSARHYFKLDEQGHRKGMAGVPPDAFSDDGQLWGMPVFRWDIMKKDGYQWWIDRIRKNIELFDLVRLDHFRAFSAYWEVPAKEKTARKGKWVKGPGNHFFRTMKKVFGDLPFIAEDLGDIDEPVYRLRDHFLLPGMKILQFAFGEDTGSSPHAPHNYKENFIVYPGTHDNNTTRGWWRQEGQQARPYLEAYVGRSLHEDEVPGLLCRMAYASTASVAILPVQDVLGLDEIARMNQPSSAAGNWAWRLLPGQINEEAERKLKSWTKLYNRR